MKRLFNSLIFVILQAFRALSILCKCFLITSSMRYFFSGIENFYSLGNKIFMASVIISSIFDVWCIISRYTARLFKYNTESKLSTSLFPPHWTSRAKLWSSERYDPGLYFEKQNIKCSKYGVKITSPEELKYCASCHTAYHTDSGVHTCLNCESTYFKYIR